MTTSPAAVSHLGGRNFVLIFLVTVFITGTSSVRRRLFSIVGC